MKRCGQEEVGAALLHCCIASLFCAGEEEEEEEGEKETQESDVSFFLRIRHGGHRIHTGLPWRRNEEEIRGSSEDPKRRNSKGSR